MDLSIVIVSFNTRELTCSCIEAIMEQTRGLEYEIIVVDNASDDGSADAIAARFPAVRLLRNDHNAGFAAAQNRGLLASRGDCLLILNSDALLQDNAAGRMAAFLRGGAPELGVVGPQIRNADGSIAPSGRRALRSTLSVMVGIVNRHFNLKRFLPREAFLRRYFGFLLGRLHDNYASHSRQRTVDYVDGMCLMIKRRALEQSGLFDEQFFFDMEIVDLCNRIRAAGWQIVFYPQAQVIHLAHSSRRKVSRIVVETHRSELIYHARYAPAMVGAIKRTSILVVRLRMALARLRLLRFPSAEARREFLSVRREIVEVCRTFDPAAARREEKIPSLLPRQSASAAVW